MHKAVGYRAEIDGLRAVAVLTILLHHAGVPWLPGGYLGVDMFFVVSGFVITRLLVAELDSGTFDAAAFWRRRVRRILPPLVVLLAVVLTAAWGMMSARQMEDFLPVFLGATAMVPNIVLWDQVGYFSQVAKMRPLLHLWSLGVEEQFYLLYPLLLAGLAGLGLRSRGRVWALWALALASLTLAGALVVVAPSAGFYLLPSRVWELLAGALAALSLWHPGLRARQVWALLGLALMLVPMLVYETRSPGPATVPPILGAALCLMVARPDTWVGKGLALGPMVAVGKISFGAYLWHWPLLVFTRIHMAEEPSLALKLGLMAVALGLGWASWRFVEAPFRRAERPVFPRFGIAVGVASLAGLATIGGAVMLAEARDWRRLDWPGYSPSAIRAIEVERGILVRSKICHLGDESVPPGPFMAQWACGQPDATGQEIWPVGVFGDSIGSDFAMVLRATGRNPMQMTGFGCALLPDRMRPECREMAELFRATAKASGIRTVILINRWEPAELTPQALVDLELWWGEVFDTVVLVAPLPRFAELEERLLRWPRDRVAGLQPDFSEREAFLRARSRVQGSEMRVIDAAALFCGARPGCSPLGEGPLLLDGSGHLTPEGARLYGQALEASGDLDGMVP
ncbi:acyltransferase [Tabrizicola piscis]|uniref:Acyltransferase n=1 Tax=Tabrizicola piscis TaxID=2494374 RepID=A0A3S8U275_9RHOB|nr:acyltransferase family protein [Tabrizicola piscis]AZL57711.1 acyltransferase [Tabrizicola piscis]